MQSLKVYQSLWATELRQPGKPESSEEKRFQAIAEAGYSGVCLDPIVEEIDECLARKHLFQRFGLECMINAFPKDDDGLKKLLDLSVEMDATTFSVVGLVFPQTVAEAVPVVTKWIDIAKNMGADILFETHRNCLTNDMFLTSQLIREIPEMKLCADLSHYVVAHEFPMPISDQHEELIEQLLQRSESFQGRFASDQQIQTGFPQHAEWVDVFKSWWLRGFDFWRRNNDDESNLVFLCELGPPPYAITDGNGRELSDRWIEALSIKEWVENTWCALNDQSVGD
ncbi:MAG: sugar phosphate isomerase/epimerase [Pseudomonadota bacterium]